jgi:hypothetical protein
MRTFDVAAHARRRLDLAEQQLRGSDYVRVPLWLVFPFGN